MEIFDPPNILVKPLLRNVRGEYCRKIITTIILAITPGFERKLSMS